MDVESESVCALHRVHVHHDVEEWGGDASAFSATLTAKRRPVFVRDTKETKPSKRSIQYDLLKVSGVARSRRRLQVKGKNNKKFERRTHAKI